MNQPITVFGGKRQTIPDTGVTTGENDSDPLRVACMGEGKVRVILMVTEEPLSRYGWLTEALMGIKFLGV